MAKRRKKHQELLPETQRQRVTPGPKQADVRADADQDIKARPAAAGAGRQAAVARKLLELQASHGNKWASHAAVSHELSIGPHPAATLNREPISIEIVKAPPKLKGTVESIVLDTMRTLIGISVNFNGALDNFETVVNESSKEEAKMKEAGSIILEEAAKFALGKAADYATSLVPGGKVAKEIFDLTKSMAGAIDKEKKRSAAASESNALKNFITSLRNTITTSHSSLLAAMGDDAAECQAKYDSKPNQSEKDGYRDYLEFRNHEVTQALKTYLTVEALFTRIVEAWINQSIAPGKAYDAEVRVALDHNWNVIDATIDAPRGSRLAEQLLITGGGQVDLATLDVKRTVTWFPVEGKDTGLARCWAKVSSSGQITEIGTWHFGRPYFDEFRQLIASKPIPATTKLSGHKTGG